MTRIDGRKISEEIKAEMKKEISRLGKPLKLSIIQVGEDDVSNRFVRAKQKFAEEAGVEIDLRKFPENEEEQKLILDISSLADDESVSGIIVQLPLPEGVDSRKLTSLIPPEKDVDALSANPRVLSPTVAAIREILRRNNLDVAGKKVAVVGRGFLVGAPASEWARREGAEVLTADEFTPDVGAITREADIVISGAGRPGLIKPEMIKEGAVLIDAGTSELKGELRGDIDSECEEKTSLYTPVPGGVGPVTVAMVFKNLLELNKQI